MENVEISERKRQMLIGQTHQLMAKGHTTTEIAEKLKMPESAIRSYAQIVQEAEANRNAK